MMQRAMEAHEQEQLIEDRDTWWQDDTRRWTAQEFYPKIIVKSGQQEYASSAINTTNTT